MATIKSYTTVEQSRKLAEILPLESADMCLNISVRRNMPPLMAPYSRFDEFFNISPTPDFLIPCWSLAALLNILPKQVILSSSEDLYWYCKYEDSVNCFFADASNPLDACYEMILKLHEQKKL